MPISGAGWSRSKEGRWTWSQDKTSVEIREIKKTTRDRIRDKWEKKKRNQQSKVGNIFLTKIV